MRFTYAVTCATALALLVPTAPGAQTPPAQPPAAPTAQDKDKDRVVAGGGISVEGWKGRIDPGAAKKGGLITHSKFEKAGDALHLAIGPAAVYWNPANTAKGDYTVKASFKEAKPDAGHPHPYGVFIGGSSLDTDTPTLVYCLAYSDGTFLVRGFNQGNVVQVSKRGPHAAVNKPGADGSVTNEVAWKVTGDRAECLINGQSVASFAKSDLVAPGKLESTDGIVGIRVSHNVDVTVSGFGITK